ncbi:VanW family protein [Alkalihalophilus lindianensis]|uniref:VanW family protein n=1 Tax=Alkalihalophilus lindianensis TaxID=1630542 RepID=A0ABU3X683_9BACI|nr:VanW family protein [Alkalihalophilus lindianensis]MDV2683408.1 VanW family protein [Alkalihalophilus lindianensis]
MRRRLLTVGFVFLIGTLQVSAEENLKAKDHFIYDLNTNNWNLRTPVIWEVALVDERDQSIQLIALNEFGYQPGVDVQEEELRAFASELAQTIDTPMRNPTINKEGIITPGQARVILAEEELVEQLMNASFLETQLPLPIYVEEPTVSEEELEGIDLYEIGSFTTYFNSGVQGRSENIRRSAESIQDFVLGPGDHFSFNQIVGERTLERGYKEAKEIVNKQFVMGIGGGICQTSSTLYNAVDAAGLEMVERITHSKEIGYVPAGRDATVSWGGPDFKFKNPHTYPIIIRTDVSLERGEITVSVYTNNESPSS